MPYAWGPTSIARLQTCHELLRELFARVIKRPDLPHDLTVLCGVRGKAEQDAAVKSGASKLAWPKSKHNKTPSEAVDVAPIVKGSVSWDWAAYNATAPIIKAEWAKMEREGLTHGVTLSWGGDWASFKDGPHWEVRGV
jgi:peptidoglycan L-alanyl-D-glutamate endopeptidase CwlK